MRTYFLHIVSIHYSYLAKLLALARRFRVETEKKLMAEQYVCKLRSLKKKLLADGFAIVKHVDSADLDGIVESLGGLLPLHSRKVLDRLTKHSAGQGHPHFRTGFSKFFTTVDIRSPDHIILPHCEGPTHALYEVSGSCCWLGLSAKSRLSFIYPNTFGTGWYALLHFTG